MSREVRRVPATWEHPVDVARPTYHNGETRYVPLFEAGRPDTPPEECMPDWPEEERTHWQMYETTTEGTPISPPMPSPEALADWLVENRASAFGSMTATREEWLATILRGSTSCSAVRERDGTWRSGVEVAAHS